MVYEARQYIEWRLNLLFFTRVQIESQTALKSSNIVFLAQMIFILTNEVSCILKF